MTEQYDSWRQVPEHLRTRTQLADLDLPRHPGGPARAHITVRSAIGRRESFEQYDERKSEPTPASAKQPADNGDEHPCDICADGYEDCGCDDDTGCWSCGGSGQRIPEHCCACGGSPYCNCCSQCGAPCVADCCCPITVQQHDGTSRIV